MLTFHLELTVEARKGMAVDRLEELEVCCDYPPSGRCSSRCACKGHPQVSNLLQIRWKRLIIDEGHNTTNDTTQMVEFLCTLNVERRWAVTGTPTALLLGLNLGKHVSLFQNDRDRLTPDSATSYPDDAAEGSSIFGEIGQLRYPTAEELLAYESQLAFTATTLAEDGRSDTEEPLSRVWADRERNDVLVILKMIVGFLRMPQFALDSRKFASHVLLPLFDARGPRFGAVRVLEQILNMIMIRHQYVES